MRRLGLTVALGLLALLAMRPVAATAMPNWPAIPISSSFGSGAFGTWREDPFGLPSYRYTIDELRSSFARQPELAGSTDAIHQVGNDRLVADAFNHGYVELWSQDRRYEWANRYDAHTLHYAGGYGYLRVGGRTISTLYDDRPPTARTTRDFGVGYFRRALQTAGLTVDELVYAPFGNDPVLLHDVTIRNDGRRRRRVTWFEYWDVNPFDQATRTPVALGGVRWIRSTGTLVAPQLATGQDHRPLTLFAATLRGPRDGHFGDTRDFFGSGQRAVPAAVSEDQARGALATPRSGRAMFALKSVVTLGPHASTTLRYVYGIAHRQQIGGLIRRYRRARSPLRSTEQHWRRWLPRISLGPGRQWLSRELQWDAYTVRSGATYEECRGRHIISQGGYYQYALGFQGAFRDPLQHILPMIYMDPALARDALLYSAEEQPQDGQIPYAMSELCHKFKFGDADDLDLWLLLAASEYGLATRDLGVFDKRVTFADGGATSLWDHLKLAFAHQQSLLGPHGGYLALDTGDWSDLSPALLGMTESTLVDAQAAYIYPHLAALADARGDPAFARRLRAAAAQDLRIERGQWTARGWYARGYADDRQIGTGAIFGEPQPWAILAGAPRRSQARTLVAGIRRYLTGVGAPRQLHGPSVIGSAQSPATGDPGITENSHPPNAAIGARAAVFPGGSWYAVNGWLTWALGELGPEVPHARSYAFSELERNTLAAHATAYPRHWDGTISVDDVCDAFYSPTPRDCGAGLTTDYAGQIMHQPAWSLFDAIKLAGVIPTMGGFRIMPELPFRTFTLELPDIGVAYGRREARGYVRVADSEALTMQVRPPGDGRRWHVWIGRHRVSWALRRGMLTFTLPARRGRAVAWKVSAA